MAGEATINTRLRVSGLGSNLDLDSEKTLAKVPVEVGGGQGTYVIVATAQTTALQLSDLVPHIPLDKMFKLYIKAVSGSIYLQLDTAGTTTFAAAAADIVIPEGDSDIISLNPDNNAGVTIDAASATDAFEFAVLGEA